MNCPRCGEQLERYTLEDREAASCGDCGYVGVPVEHRGETRQVESWEKAISRYPDAARARSVTVEAVDGEPALEVVLGPDGDDGESPAPTVVRVESPDPALAAAFDAADGDDDRFVCAVCDEEFDEQSGLYGHLAVHSGDKRENA